MLRYERVMRLTNLFFKMFVVAALVVQSNMLTARSWSFNDPHDSVPDHIDDYQWQEQGVDLPSYPKEEELLELRFDHAGARFQFSIDPNSLSLGEDGVVRYTLVMRSPSGSKNVMYEGMHCTERQYKTYAWGTRKNEFRRLSKPRWQNIESSRSNWFRHDLWEHYLCGRKQSLKYTLSVPEILDAIKYHRDAVPGRR